SVPPAPFGRRNEGAGPDAALTGLRLVLLGSICTGEAVGHGPTLPHHPAVDVGAAGCGANRQHAPIAIESSGRAGQLAAGKIELQLMRCRATARPRLAAGIGAGLIRFRRVDALEPNAPAGDIDGVAVDHVGPADDRRRRRAAPMPRPAAIAERVLAGPMPVGGVAGRARQNDDDHERANVGALNASPTLVALVVSSMCPMQHRWPAMIPNS